MKYLQITKRGGKRFMSPSDAARARNSPITHSWLLAVLANSKAHIGNVEIDPAYREAAAIQQDADNYLQNLGPADRQSISERKR